MNEQKPFQPRLTEKDIAWLTEHEEYVKAAQPLVSRLYLDYKDMKALIQRLKQGPLFGLLFTNLRKEKQGYE